MRVERLHQLEVLVDHADLEFAAHRAGRGSAPRAVDHDTAFIRRVEAGGDIHQRRLAGAVLAEQRMDLAALDRRNRRAIERHEAVEGLADAGEFEGGVI